MNEIILAMMLWISNVTGYSIPQQPDILFLSSHDIKAYAYGCDDDPIPPQNLDYCEAREFWEVDDMGKFHGPIALYDHIKKTVILNENFDINQIHDQSVIFHELVHHLQYNDGEDKRVKCMGELEKEAYNLQDKWLQEKYGVTVWDTIHINRLFFMLITRCEKHHHGLSHFGT